MFLALFSRSYQKEHERQQCQEFFKLCVGLVQEVLGLKLKIEESSYGIKFLRPDMCHPCLRMES